MALLRIEKVVHSLSAAERTAVERAISEHHRREMQLLWREVSRIADTNQLLEDNKKDVYKAVYGKRYSEKNDYLLRNEYRLLLNKLYSVIAACERDDPVSANPFDETIALLRALMKKQLWQEFDGIMEKTLLRARECCDQRSLLQLMQLNMASVSQRGAISHERMLGFVERLDEELAELKAFYVSESLRIGALRSAAEHTITLFGFPYTPRPVEIENDFTGITSPLIEYYELKARSLKTSTPPQEKVAAAQKAVEILMSLSDENISLRRERIIAHSNCGALLMTVANDYPAAAAMNLRALELMKQYRLGEIDVQVYYNYCSALMKSKEYQNVLDAIGEHEEKLLSDQRVGFRFSILKTFALIFLRDWQTAMKTLPQYINRYPENEYHYAWFQLSILAYLRGDPEDALREIQNFAKRFSRRNLEILQPHQHELVNAFRSFYHAVIEKDDTKRMRKFLDTAKKNLNKAQSTGIFIPDYLPIVWLRGELESLDSR